MTEPSELKRSDARRNRDAILAAALAALTESPDASLNAIAKRAGVANATLYRHFPTRAELVLATYEREVGKLVDAADVLLRKEAPMETERSSKSIPAAQILRCCIISPTRRTARFPSTENWC